MTFGVNDRRGDTRERLARAAGCLVAGREGLPDRRGRRWWSGWDEWEMRLGRCGLTAGAVHEWFGEEGPEDRKGKGWWPPLCLLADVARRVARGAAEGSRVVWIGKRVWVYPRARGARGILERSIFVDPPGPGERVWAVDVALRCRGVAVVVADGSGLKMTESRRLQLAAAAGGVMGLLARPGWELCELSAAKTRWRVRPERSGTSGARWAVELLRCKEANPVPEGQRRWSVHYEKGDVGVAGAAGDGPAGQARSEARGIVA